MAAIVFKGPINLFDDFIPSMTLDVNATPVDIPTTVINKALLSKGWNGVTSTVAGLIEYVPLTGNSSIQRPTGNNFDVFDGVKLGYYRDANRRYIGAVYYSPPSKDNQGSGFLNKLFYNSPEQQQITGIYTYDINPSSANDETQNYKVGDRWINTTTQDEYVCLKATAPAVWKVTTSGGGGSGEANTGSNVNIGGVGVFKQKSGVDLEFRGVDAANNKVSVTLDGPNNKINVGVNEANFSGIPQSAVTNLITDVATAKGSAITFIIDNGSSVINTGYAGSLIIPYNCSVIGWQIASENGLVGSIVVDVRTGVNYASLTSIAGTEKPTLSAAAINSDLSLSTWTPALVTGRILAFNVDSVATVQKVIITLYITKG